MSWVWGMRKIIMQRPDYVLLQVTLKITLRFCFYSLYLVPNRQLSFRGSTLRKAGAKGSWFVDNRQFGTAGNPRCTLCGLCAERLAASASTPPTAPELGKEGLSSSGHAVPVLQYSSSSARASLRIPAWSHLEAWQVQLLAGSRPTSPPLRVPWC